MTVARGWLAAGGMLLAASLALNLVAIGVLAGRFLVGPSPHHGRVVVRDVPEPARPVLQAALDARREALRNRRRDIREARARIAALLAAPKLDEAALRGGLDELSRHTMALQSTVHDAVVEAARELSPEVRAQWRSAWTRHQPPR